MKYASLPLERIEAWSHLNSINLHGATIQSRIVSEDDGDKGGGIISTRDHGPLDVLMTVPRDLILNKAAVEAASRTDKHLREVLEAVGTSFTETSRATIMIFLLLQLTHSSPSFTDNNVGTTTAWSDYVKFLPKEILLPTVYGEDKQKLLSGTSAEAALEQKLTRLEQEFGHLKASTEAIHWCQQLWWDDTSGVLDLNDWKFIDTLYRSRGFELPDSLGHSMIPVLDMANHAPDGKSNARFRISGAGDAQLVVCKGVSLKAGDEITITYGHDGACEMLFSYGFIDKDMQSAQELFLGMQIPEDDPLKRAKIEFAQDAPGVRIYQDDSKQIRWESPFVWWACINEEDGLSFRVQRQNDGTLELRAAWKEVGFEPQHLKMVLQKDELWDVFTLRATVLIQDRVEMQGRELSLSQEAFDATTDHGCSDLIVGMIAKLRDLEMEMFAASYQSLEQEKIRLLASDRVRTFLNQQGPPRIDGEEDEDFS